MDGAVEQPKHCWPCRASFADVTTIKKNRIYLRSQSVVGSVIPTIPARMTHSAPSEKSKHHDFFFFPLRGWWWWWESISSSTSEKLAPIWVLKWDLSHNRAGIHSTEREKCCRKSEGVWNKCLHFKKNN